MPDTIHREIGVKRLVHPLLCRAGFVFLCLWPCLLAGGCVPLSTPSRDKAFVSASAVPDDFVYKTQIPQFDPKTGKVWGYEIKRTAPKPEDSQRVKGLVIIPVYVARGGFPGLFQYRDVEILSPLRATGAEPVALGYPSRTVQSLYLPPPFGIPFSFVGTLTTFPPGPAFLAFADDCWPLYVDEGIDCGPSTLWTNWEFPKTPPDKCVANCIFYKVTKPFGDDVREAFDQNGVMTNLLTMHLGKLTTAVDNSPALTDDDRKMIYSRVLLAAKALAAKPANSQSQKQLQDAIAVLEGKVK